MEDNEEEVISNINSGKKLTVTFIKILIICIIINRSIVAFYDYKEIKMEEKNKIVQEEYNRVINSKIKYKYYSDDEFFNIENIEEIEFDSGIKIPTLSIYTPKVKVEEFTKKIESNEIAKDSPVMIINYEEKTSTDLLINKFCEEILKEENYTLKMSNSRNEEKIYIREEVDNYFSYIIIEKYQITYGVSYGTPEINYEISEEKRSKVF